MTRKLLALTSVMEDQGFSLNHADPWDPANTYIDTLLNRRLGAFEIWGLVDRGGLGRLRVGMLSVVEGKRREFEMR